MMQNIHQLLGNLVRQWFHRNEDKLEAALHKFDFRQHLLSTYYIVSNETVSNMSLIGDSIHYLLMRIEEANVNYFQRQRIV